MIEYNKNNLLVILGNQLFPLEYISQLNINKVYMKEDIELCTYFKHHKMKLTLFLTAMRDYRDLLKKNDFEVHYKPLKIDQKWSAATTQCDALRRDAVRCGGNTEPVQAHVPSHPGMR